MLRLPEWRGSDLQEEEKIRFLLNFLQFELLVSFSSPPLVSFPSRRFCPISSISCDGTLLAGIWCFPHWVYKCLNNARMLKMTFPSEIDYFYSAGRFLSWGNVRRIRSRNTGSDSTFVPFPRLRLSTRDNWPPNNYGLTLWIWESPTSRLISPWSIPVSQQTLSPVGNEPILWGNSKKIYLL